MAAEKRPTPSHRGADVAGGPHLSIEEKYDEVRQLINIGKEKGYLLYDEVNELLPSEITSSDELAVIKSISRTPIIAKKVIELGDQLHAGERTIRELVIFNDEEITDERIVERSKQVQKQIDAVRKARAVYEKLEEKLAETPRGATTKDKRKYRKCKWLAMRAQVELSRYIRKIEFTEAVKRRLIEAMKEAVEGVKAVQREVDACDRLLNPKNKKIKLKE